MNIFFLLTFFVLSCIYSPYKKDNITKPPDDFTQRTIEVVINDIPFPTEKNLRIPYTLKMWEYGKEGLLLEQIKIMDDNSKVELMKINKAELPLIYKNPLKTRPYFTLDEINNYYLSIQLPIPIGNTVPLKISHSLTFRDTIQNKDIIVEGGIFSPRISETPLVIASPVKGKNWIFVNQSSAGYHFNVLFFTMGKLFRSERFASDLLKLDDNFTNYYQGDPKVNSSYHNYLDTLYAVANGTVISLQDGRPENHGDAQDLQFNNLDEYAGNYLILDIGGGHYVLYAHCNPNSFMVRSGSTVKEGEPIALLGNSGNSTAPHLHIQITDGTDFFLSNGIPFVLKDYTKIGDTDTGAVTPQVFTNSMMEQFTILSF